jgi:lipopolysaccharide export system permease protein
MLRARGPMSHFRGELHSRLATPILSIAYVLIGLASILAGSFNRRGMSGRIIVGALAIIVTQTSFMTLNGLVARDSGLTFLLYLVAFVPALLGLVLVSCDAQPLRRLRAVLP